MAKQAGNLENIGAWKIEPTGEGAEGNVATLHNTFMEKNLGFQPSAVREALQAGGTISPEVFAKISKARLAIAALAMAGITLVPLTGYLTVLGLTISGASKTTVAIIAGVTTLWTLAGGAYWMSKWRGKGPL